MKVLLEIAFCGTAYHGWQVQPNACTVQSTMQDAIEKIFGKRYPVTGCSRTDAGVHARSYFCCVDFGCDNIFPCEKIPTALCSALPEDISVYSAESVGDGFHPRYSCKGKEYEYLISTREYRDPFETGRIWNVARKLDIDKMKRAAELIRGKNDYSSFCAANADTSDSVRNIKYTRVSEKDGIISIKIKADGFLYNMVRIITGTLVSVGLCKINADDITKIIEKKDRTAAGQTAPACGLYLNKIFY